MYHSATRFDRVDQQAARQQFRQREVPPGRQVASHDEADQQRAGQIDVGEIHREVVIKEKRVARDSRRHVAGHDEEQVSKQQEAACGVARLQVQEALE